MIPPVNPNLLTEADKVALGRMPDGWFDEFDLPPNVRSPRFRCDRLHKLGYLQYDVIGTYPNLQARYRKTKAAASIQKDE